MTTPDPLTAALRRLPEPAPPASLEANVMARIARLPAPAEAPGGANARRDGDRAGWARASTGLLLSLGSAAFVVMTARGAAEPGSGWLSGSLDLAAASPLAPLPLAFGLLLLATGLFALAGMAPGGRPRRREPL